MSLELTLLAWTGLLSLGLALATVAIHFSRFGGKMIRGSRDDYPAVDGLAGRVARAHTNLGQALLPFAIVVLIAQAIHVSTPWTQAAAMIFLAARCGHAAFYMLGANPWRTITFYTGLLATLAFASQLPLLALR